MSENEDREGRDVEDFEDLYEDAPCGYIIVQPDGRVCRANATFSSWCGFTVDELRSRRFIDLLTVPGRIFFETHCRPLLRMQGFVHEVAIDVQTADGRRIPILAHANEKRGADGEHLETRFILTKAADRRTYERGLLQARNEVQRTLEDERQTAELREQFIAVLGHDLRNPLAAVVGVAQFLQRRERLSEQGAKFVSLMLASAQRMMGLIDNILDFARGRLGGGLILERRADLSIERTLQQVVDELKATHPDREIWSDWAITGEIPLDHRRIAQMVSNLVANALAHGAQDQPISVLGSSSAQRFELSVTNAGPPIAPATMERLFQPFFREDVRSSQQGLGLGLYIVAEIVKAHNGKIDVTSTADATTFTVHIPAVAGG